MLFVVLDICDRIPNAQLLIHRIWQLSHYNIYMQATKGRLATLKWLTFNPVLVLSCKKTDCLKSWRWNSAGVDTSDCISCKKLNRGKLRRRTSLYRTYQIVEQLMILQETLSYMSSSNYNTGKNWYYDIRHKRTCNVPIQHLGNMKIPPNGENRWMLNKMMTLR